MPDIISTVGNGHSSPDYATLALYNAGDGGLDPGAGFTSIAECSGYLGAAANINGAFVRGATIRGDVVFDGTNDSSLANTERLIISAGSGITVEDLRIFTNNQFVSALNYNADFIVMDRVVLDNTTTGVNALDINGTFINGHIRNFVARGGSDAVMAGFNQGANLTNGLIYGAADKGVEGGGSTPMLLTRIFAFNNGGQDIDSGGGFTLIDVATEDATGTYTGYTSAELVGFASGDLRTKSTSDLATLGSPFIGAFLESGGGGVTGDIAFDVDAIEFSGSGSATLPQPSGDISFELAAVEFNGTASATLPQPVGDISFDIPSIEFSGTGSATQPNPIGDIAFDIAPIEFSGTGSASLPFPVGNISFDVAPIEFSGTGSATFPQPSGDVAFDVPAIEFSGTGSATQPEPVGNISFDIPAIEFSGTGSVTGVALPSGEIIMPRTESNVIILDTPPNLIRLY